MDKKAIFSEVRDILLLVGLSAIIAVFGIGCSECRESTRLMLIMISLTSIMWILLWKGNAFLAGFLSKKISWIHFPVKRFAVGFVMTIAYTFLVVYVLGMVYKRLFFIDLSDTIVTSIIITLAISLFMHGRSFLLNWKQTAIEAERFQHESIMARYESLKNQVNPHFLFNSLNALTHLVYEDKDKAAKFIHQLSQVYRYVLESRDKEVVPVVDELEFIRSYLFLQDIRFGGKLKVSILLDQVSGFVAPLALQMLIENAIKHNVVSEDEPLSIRIFRQNDSIVVMNTLQERRKFEEPSSGLGLENISRRYEILTDRKVEIRKNNDSFYVSLPLLGSVQIQKKLKD